MRVAVSIERYQPGGGGVEYAAWRQVEVLARRGVDITVLCRTAAGTPPTGTRVRVLRVPRFWQPLRVLGFSLRAGRAGREFDVVHAFSRTRRQHIYRAGGGSHAAYLEHVYPKDRLRRFSPRHATLLAIEEAVFRDPSQLIQCNARMNAREIGERYGVPPERLVTIYNGVDAEHFHPRLRDTRGAELRKELGLAGPVALFAGSGFERKGLDRALLGLANSGVRATLLVVGAGSSEPYRELVSAYGLGDRVRFLGRRDDMAALYAAADLLVLPTRYDPFANVCLEAMSAGLAVATTTTNGASELIEPGLNGWIGADDFAPAFARLDDLPALRETGRAARQTAEQYTWGRYADRVLELYQRVCS